jgi:hypothetical protein
MSFDGVDLVVVTFFLASCFVAAFGSVAFRFSAAGFCVVEISFIACVAFDERAEFLDAANPARRADDLVTTCTILVFMLRESENALIIQCQ